MPPFNDYKLGSLNYRTSVKDHVLNVSFHNNCGENVARHPRVQCCQLLSDQKGSCWIWSHTEAPVSSIPVQDVKVVHFPYKI